MTSFKDEHRSRITPQELDEYYAQYLSDAPRAWRIDHGFESAPQTAAPILGIPPAYLQEFHPDEASVIDLQLTDGILSETGPIGLLITGGTDVRRGGAAALLLTRACGSGRTGLFIDYPELVDRCRSAPLYGPDSRAAILSEPKHAGVLVIHAVDSAIARRQTDEPLWHLLRLRTASRLTSILTTRMGWRDIHAHQKDAREVGEYLEACLIIPGKDSLNVISLS